MEDIYWRALFIFREKGKGRRNRGRETSVCGCLSPASYWGLGQNTGMCPGWESNQQPFGLQASTRSTEPHQPRLSYQPYLASVASIYTWLLNCICNLDLFSTSHTQTPNCLSISHLCIHLYIVNSSLFFRSLLNHHLLRDSFYGPFLPFLYLWPRQGSFVTYFHVFYSFPSKHSCWVLWLLNVCFSH